MRRLSESEVTKALEGLPGWERSGEMLERSFQFQEFMEAIHFVNAAAVLAEEMAHHPDMDIRYSKVRFMLTTHDAGGLSELDVTFARRLEERLSASARECER